MIWTDMNLFKNAKYKNFLYYLIVCLFFCLLISAAEYFLGRINGVEIKRSERARFISETAPLLISANHLLKDLDHTFTNEQRSSADKRYFRTDSYGLVKGIANEDDDSNSLRVLFLGGSTTENNEVEEAFRFPYLTGELISSATNVKVTGVNAGVRGHTTQDSINIYLNHPSPLIKNSKVVVMMHNINDRLRLSIDEDYKSKINNSSSIDFIGLVDSIVGVVFSLRDFLIYNTNIGYLINESVSNFNRKNSAQVFINESALEKLPPLSNLQVAKFEQNYKNFVALAKANNQIPVFMTQPLGRKSNNQEQFNDAIRRVGRLENVEVIDLAKYIFEVDQFNLFFYDDGIHFNNDGSRWAADVIAEKLAKILNLKYSTDNLQGNCQDLRLNGKSFLNKPPYANIFLGRYPSFNYSEDKLLFQSNGKHGSLLAYLDMKTGLVVELLKDNDSNALEHPTWFDNKSILYTKNSHSSKDVYYLNWYDGINKKILDEVDFASAIPFADNEGRIFFSGYRNTKYGPTPPAIYLMRNLEKVPEKLYSNDFESWRPVVSAGSVLFINNESGKYQIYESGLSSGDRKIIPLIPSEGVQWDPISSLDGRYIAFAEKKFSHFDIFIFDRKKQTSNKLLKIAGSSADEWDPRISPQGKYLLYSVSTHVGDQIRAKCIN
jgi:lysophospholipase L1-like esterase